MGGVQTSRPDYNNDRATRGRRVLSHASCIMQHTIQSGAASASSRAGRCSMHTGPGRSPAVSPDEKMCLLIR